MHVYVLEDITEKETSHYAHRVVEVIHLARRLPRCWIAQTGIVDVTHHALKPGKHASGWHGFIWVVTYKIEVNTYCSIHLSNYMVNTLLIVNIDTVIWFVCFTFMLG